MLPFQVLGFRDMGLMWSCVKGGRDTLNRGLGIEGFKNLGFRGLGVRGLGVIRNIP